MGTEAEKIGREAITGQGNTIKGTQDLLFLETSTMYTQTIREMDDNYMEREHNRMLKQGVRTGIIVGLLLGMLLGYGMADYTVDRPVPGYSQGHTD